MKFNLGKVVVAIEGGRTLTSFGDGHYLIASHSQQEGQDETAHLLGMTVEEMNVSHDLVHSLLALWLGLHHSPTLHDIASGTAHIYEHHAAEEDAVKAIQKFGKLKGIDFLKVAERWSEVAI